MYTRHVVKSALTPRDLKGLPRVNSVFLRIVLYKVNSKLSFIYDYSSYADNKNQTGYECNHCSRLRDYYFTNPPRVLFPSLTALKCDHRIPPMVSNELKSSMTSLSVNGNSK